MLFVIPAILQMDSHFRDTLYVRTTFACKYVLSFFSGDFNETRKDVSQGAATRG